jgi:hypothetical protein
MASAFFARWRSRPLNSAIVRIHLSILRIEYQHIAQVNIRLGLQIGGDSASYTRTASVTTAGPLPTL